MYYVLLLLRMGLIPDSRFEYSVKFVQVYNLHELFFMRVSAFLFFQPAFDNTDGFLLHFFR